MSVTSASRAGRRAAERTMLDTFTAHVPDPNSTTTDADGFPVPGYADGGATNGKVAGPSTQARDTNARTVTVGGVERTLVEGGLHIPVDAFLDGSGHLLLTAGDKGTGWELELTTLGPGTDPSLLGSRWLVYDAPAKSHATARRLDVVRLS